VIRTRLILHRGPIPLRVGLTGLLDRMPPRSPRRHRIDTPMNKNAKLRLVKPRWTRSLIQGLPVGGVCHVVSAPPQPQETIVDRLFPGRISTFPCMFSLTFWMFLSRHSCSRHCRINWTPRRGISSSSSTKGRYRWRRETSPGILSPNTFDRQPSLVADLPQHAK